MIQFDVFCVNSRNSSVYLSYFKCYFAIKRNFSAYLLNHADSLISWSLRVRSEFKQYLKFGKCQSQDFDAQISRVTTTYILCVFLSYFRRVNDYETLGVLFEHDKDEMIEKNLAERLWDMFEELLQVVITAGSRLWNGRHQRVQKLPRISISKGSYLKTNY